MTIKRTQYFGVIGNRDYIKHQGVRKPYWEFLDTMPDGWLTSITYQRKDLPSGRTIFDCGAWSYKNLETPRIGKNEVTPEWAYEQYLKLAQSGDFLVAPDHMLVEGTDLTHRRRLNTTNAKRFLKICASDFMPMAVIHGMDIRERLDNAKKLTDMGYRAVSMGGVAARAAQKSLVVEFVDSIRAETRGVWLHVLGLSSPDYFRHWNRIRVDSCDGSSHFKQAFTGGAFFERDGARLIKHQAGRTNDAAISIGQCPCKVCSLLRDEGIDTRYYGSNETNMGRAAHNQNMLQAAQRHAIQKNICLVSCVSEKGTTRSKAKDLYVSPWFKKARTYAESISDEWYVLSAKHGLLHPETEVDPYNESLHDATLKRVVAWSTGVAEALNKMPAANVTILAGNKYRQALVPLLRHDVIVPMAGLGIGEQLAWLKERTDEIHPDLFGRP